MKPLDKIYDKYRSIKNKASNERSADEELLVEFVSIIIDFYKIYDIHEQTNHAQILQLLFLNKWGLTGEAIAQRSYISIKTFYRFKKKYSIFMLKALQLNIFGERYRQVLSDFSVKAR